MNIINALSSELKERLPPCLDSMRQEVVEMVDYYWVGEGHIGISIRGNAGYEMKTAPTSSIKIFGSKEIKLGKIAAKTTFTHEQLKPGVEGIHYFWHENGLSCEILTAQRSREMVKHCYEGPFQGTLLSKACIDPSINTDPLIPSETSTDWLPSVTQAAAWGIGAIAAVKVAQHLWKGDTSKALVWSSVVVACLAIR